MKEQSTSIFKSAATVGVYIAVIQILVSVVFYVSGQPFSEIQNYLSWPLLFACAIWAQLSYRKSLGGEITYGQAFGAGFLAIAVSSLISSIYVYLLYTVIDPTLSEQLRLFTEQKLVEQGNIPDAQIDQVVEMTAKFQKPAFMLLFGVFGGALFGAVISLITAIFTKKAPKEEF